MNSLSTRLAVLMAAPLLLGAISAPGEVRVELGKLRSGKGMVLMCLSGNPKHFPDCGADPAARTVTAPTGQRQRHVFTGVAAGDYAISVVHDENGNGKLDKSMGIPREGFGFSRSPVVRFGPPKYRDVRVSVPMGGTSLPITMQYFM